MAIGGNDIGSSDAGNDYAKLLRTLSAFSPRLIGVAVVSDERTNKLLSSAAAAEEVPFVNTPIAPELRMKDGIHFTGGAYRLWLPPLEAAIVKACS